MCASKPTPIKNGHIWLQYHKPAHAFKLRCSEMHIHSLCIVPQNGYICFTATAHLHTIKHAYTKTYSQCHKPAYVFKLMDTHEMYNCTHAHKCHKYIIRAFQLMHIWLQWSTHVSIRMQGKHSHKLMHAFQLMHRDPCLQCNKHMYTKE